MTVKQPAPLGVTQPNCDIGRSNDVGEYDRGQHSISHLLVAAPRQEFLDGSSPRRYVPEWDVVDAIEGNELGAWNLRWDVLPCRYRYDQVSPPMKHQGGYLNRG